VAVSNRLPASKARGSNLLAKDFTHGRIERPNDLMKHPAASGGVKNSELRTQNPGARIQNPEEIIGATECGEMDPS
jgi:hypothetical protein